jgi:hypothetical protein
LLSVVLLDISYTRFNSSASHKRFVQFQVCTIIYNTLAFFAQLVLVWILLQLAKSSRPSRAPATPTQTTEEKEDTEVDNNELMNSVKTIEVQVVDESFELQATIWNQFVRGNGSLLVGSSHRNA